MRKYFVYNHPEKGTEAVISGFTWPPFFFGPFWLAYKGLWTKALLVLTALVVLGIIGSISQQASLPGLSLIISIIQLGGYFSLSFIGNEWICKKLLDSGYLLVGIFDASNSDEAIEMSRTAKGLSAVTSERTMKSTFDRVEPTFNGASSVNVDSHKDDPVVVVNSHAEPTPSKPKSMTKKIGWGVVKIIGIILLIIAATVGSVIGKFVGKSAGKEISSSVLDKSPEQNTEKGLVLANAISDLKKKLPVKLDGGIIGTDVRAGDGYQIVYEYMIPSNIILSPDFKIKQQRNAIKAYCDNMKSFVELGISAQWLYKHNSKQYAFTATPLDCTPTKK